jgi:hypothetical protein
MVSRLDMPRLWLKVFGNLPEITQSVRFDAPNNQLRLVIPALCSPSQCGLDRLSNKAGFPYSKVRKATPDFINHQYYQQDIQAMNPYLGAMFGCRIYEESVRQNCEDLARLAAARIRPLDRDQRPPVAFSKRRNTRDSESNSSDSRREGSQPGHVALRTFE